MKKIMVATDGSASAGRAVDFASELAQAVHAELVIVTVAGDLAADQMRALSRSEGDVGSVLDRIAEELIELAATRALDKGVSSVRRHVLWDSPAKAIIFESEREAVDMIVVGRRGRGQLSGLILGSVSLKLVSHSCCPVIVVP